VARGIPGGAGLSIEKARLGRIYSVQYVQADVQLHRVGRDGTDAPAIVSTRESSRLTMVSR
jgi:hypothetical protein